jgi:surfactin synthase thioesterase subunit
VFLFGPAGGSAAVFQPWLGALGPGVRACPVELPGHGRRMAEPAPRDLGALVADLDGALAPPSGGPWAMLGHSMGALVAAGWAAYAHRLGHPPSVLYLSGAVPPWRARAAEAVAGLDDDGLWRYLTGLGGVPAGLGDSPAARRLLVGAMRRDLELASSWRPAAPPAMGCPIVVFGGRDDPAVARRLLDGWRPASAGGFRRLILPGGHFYRDGLVDLLPVVRMDLPARIAAHTVAAEGRTS